VLPDGLTQLGDDVFKGCSSLTSVSSLPDGLTKTGDGVLRLLLSNELGAPGRGHTAGLYCVLRVLLPDERGTPGRGHTARRLCVWRVLLFD